MASSPTSAPSPVLEGGPQLARENEDLMWRGSAKFGNREALEDVWYQLSGNRR